MTGIGRFTRARATGRMFEETDPKRQKMDDGKDDDEKPSGFASLLQQMNVANKLEAEFLCPLTLELPEDPVLAADGRVYEREAIAKLIRLAESSGKAFKSPVTNQVIEKTLMPCPLQMRNAMNTLLESGAIAEPPDWWIVKQMRAKAEKGDILSMYSLARLYESGGRGLKVDPCQAFAWFKKCSDANDTRGLAKYGMYLLLGRGTAKNETEGALYLGMAAGEGSKLAAFVIGRAYHEGSSGMSKDPAKAEHWLSKIVGAHPSQLAPADLKRTAEMLESIREERSENCSPPSQALPISVRTGTQRAASTATATATASDDAAVGASASASATLDQRSSASSATARANARARANDDGAANEETNISDNDFGRRGLGRGVDLNQDSSMLGMEEQMMANAEAEVLEEMEGDLSMHPF